MPDAVTASVSDGAPPLALSYVLPVRLRGDEPIDDLAAYVGWLSTQVCDVVVVDGSEPDVLARNAEQLGAAGATVVPPDERTPMGKVGGVLTGLRLATCESVVVADDDVRYDRAGLARLAARLETDDVVRPQNHFDPLPWHARIDTGRTLLNRMTGGDWPGTFGVRRSLLLAVGGYAGDVMFENLEMVRTIKAAGGTEAVDLGLYVHRTPCSTSHYVGQRVRQAYDELARPHRMAFFLGVAPATATLVARRRWGALGAAFAACVGVAEAGRRRAGGTDYFPATSSLLAPVWLLERGVSSWLALGSRLRGGVRYRDGRLRRAATPRRELVARVRAAGGPRS